MSTDSYLRSLRIQPSRIALTLVISVVAAALSTACGPDKPKLKTVCGVVVDPTSYAKNYEIDRRIEGELIGVLTKHECDRAVIGAVTGAFDTSPCLAASMQVEPTRPGGPAQISSERTQLQKKAVAAARERMTCAKKDQSGSDVVGALRGVSQNMRQELDNGDRPVLLVFSDLVQNSGNIRLYQDREELVTSQGRAAIVAKIRRIGLPDLHGFTVQVFGFGARFVDDADSAANFRTLWEDVFRVSGNPQWIPA
ncbi:MAG TPA: hypothetical protein VE465_16325 [Streptosporangiaceae bacterium]|jgi:hypothetical protein|nr:hypothetical protein [Streptosporangiaceae bacterium]